MFEIASKEDLQNLKSRTCRFGTRAFLCFSELETLSDLAGCSQVGDPLVKSFIFIQHPPTPDNHIWDNPYLHDRRPRGPTPSMEIIELKFHLQWVAAISCAGECEGDDDDHKGDGGSTADGQIAASDFHCPHDSPDKSRDSRRHNPTLAIIIRMTRSNTDQNRQPMEAASCKLSLDWLGAQPSALPEGAERSLAQRVHCARTTIVAVVEGRRGPRIWSCAIVVGRNATTSLPILHPNSAVSTHQCILTFLRFSRRYHAFVYFRFCSEIAVQPEK